jgi:hypothetical protein
VALAAVVVSDSALPLATGWLPAVGVNPVDTGTVSLVVLTWSCCGPVDGALVAFSTVTMTWSPAETWVQP